MLGGTAGEVEGLARGHTAQSGAQLNPSSLSVAALREGTLWKCQLYARRCLVPLAETSLQLFVNLTSIY